MESHLDQILLPAPCWEPDPVPSLRQAPHEVAEAPRNCVVEALVVVLGEEGQEFLSQNGACR